MASGQAESVLFQFISIQSSLCR